MDSMIIIAGIWLIILPYMNWSSIGKKMCLLYFVIGMSACLSGILLMTKNIEANSIYLKIVFGAVCILEMLEIVGKLRRKKTIIDTLGVIISTILLTLAVILFIIAPIDVWSSIVMVVGAMIILSVSYKKSENNTHTVKNCN